MTLLRDAALVAAVLAAGAAVGHRLGRPLLGGLSRAERLAWGGAIGVLLEVALFLAFVLIGIAPTALPMLVGIAVAALAALILVRGPRAPVPGGPDALGRRPPDPPKEATTKPTAAVVVLLSLAAAAAVIFAVLALSEPMWSNDFQAIWGLKAKTIALTGRVPARLFHDPALAWSHPEYPLLLPLVLAAVSAAAGGWNDHALAVVFPFFGILLLLALGGAVARRSGAAAGGLAALLAASFFSLFHAFEVGMAEIPLAAFLVLFGTAALDFAEEPSAAAGVRVALAALLAAATKQEGSLFVLVAATWIAATAFRGRRGAGAFWTCAAVPVVAHQAALVLARGWIRDRDYDFTLLGPSRWSALGPRIAAVLARARDPIAANAIPLVVLVAFLVLARDAGGSRSLALLGPPLLAQAAIYAAICALSAFDPRWQAQFLPRLVGALFPVLLLAAGPRLAFVVGEGRVPPE